MIDAERNSEASSETSWGVAARFPEDRAVIPHFSGLSQGLASPHSNLELGQPELYCLSSRVLVAGVRRFLHLESTASQPCRPRQVVKAVLRMCDGPGCLTHTSESDAGDVAHRCPSRCAAALSADASPHIDAVQAEKAPAKKKLGASSRKKKKTKAEVLAPCSLSACHRSRSAQSAPLYAM